MKKILYWGSLHSYEIAHFGLDLLHSVEYFHAEAEIFNSYYCHQLLNFLFRQKKPSKQTKKQE